MEGKWTTGVPHSFGNRSTVVGDRMGNRLRIFCLAGRFYRNSEMGDSRSGVFNRLPLCQVDAFGA